YSEAFRAPSWFERYYADPTGTIAAPDLRPESVRSVEVSFEQRVQAQRVLFGFFRSWWGDIILAEPLGAKALQQAIATGQLTPWSDYADQSRNVESVESYGFNALFEGSALGNRLRYGASLTGSFARSRTTAKAPEQQLPVAPSVSGNARISYD